MLRKALLSFLLLIAERGLGLATPNQPVYLYLYSRIDDYVNSERSEARLRHTLQMVEHYRTAFPQYRISCLIQFSGAMSHVLSEQNTSSGLVNLVKDYVRRGIIEIGYDGRDEPTYSTRPRPDLRNAKTPEDRWQTRQITAGQILTQFKDLTTGIPDARRSGGWKRTREVFGELASATNVTPDLGGDSEFVHTFRLYKAGVMIMSGLPEPDPARNVHGYRASVQTFGWLMSPEPDSSPELYWQDNVLRSSETSDPAARVVRAYEGPVVMKKALEGLDRSRVRVVRVELASDAIDLQPDYTRNFLYPPLRFAFDHPDRPRLPAEAIRSQKEIDEAYANEDGMLKWLASDYFPNNPGSRFVSSTDLTAMARKTAGALVPKHKLDKAVTDLLERWGAGTYPPSFVQVDRDYFSLSDLFQMLTNALSELYRKDRLPDAVRLTPTYGPLEMNEDHGANEGTVSVAAIARVAAECSDRLNDSNWKPLPGNVVPSGIWIEGMQLNAAQFLRLMAHAYRSPEPNRKVDVRMSYMFSAAGEMFPRTIRRSEQGAAWTFKPAPLDLPVLPRPQR